MIKILLITRCSRLDFLEKISENIIKLAKKFNTGKFVWCVAFDTNRITIADINRKWLDEMLKCNEIEFQYMYSSSDDNRYGSNIANDALFKFKNRFDITHVYLLDDDNALHEMFDELCRHLYEDDEHITLFNQLRLNKKDGNILLVGVDYTISPENVVGWVDSAQFVIPFKVLIEHNGYEDGYCIDGLTIKKLLKNGVTYKCIKSTAALYNYFTELESVYHY